MTKIDSRKMERKKERKGSPCPRRPVRVYLCGSVCVGGPWDHSDRQVLRDSDHLWCPLATKRKLAGLNCDINYLTDMLL